jgi:hypothetical protein
MALTGSNSKKHLEVLRGDEGYCVGYAAGVYGYDSMKVTLMIRKSKVLSRRKNIDLRQNIMDMILKGKMEEAEAELLNVEKHYAYLLSPQVKATINKEQSIVNSNQRLRTPAINQSRSPFSKRPALAKVSQTKPKVLLRRTSSKKLVKGGSQKSIRPHSHSVTFSPEVENIEPDMDTAEPDTPRTVCEDKPLHCAICTQDFASEAAFTKHREFSRCLYFHVSLLSSYFSPIPPFQSIQWF